MIYRTHAPSQLPKSGFTHHVPFPNSTKKTTYLADHLAEWKAKKDKSNFRWAQFITFLILALSSCTDNHHVPDVQSCDPFLCLAAVEFNPEIINKVSPMVVEEAQTKPKQKLIRLFLWKIRQARKTPLE